MRDLVSFLIVLLLSSMLLLAPKAVNVSEGWPAAMLMLSLTFGAIAIFEMASKYLRGRGR